MTVWVARQARISLGSMGWFHGAAVEPVVEFGHVALQVLLLDLVVCTEQESFQVRQGNVNPWK